MSSTAKVMTFEVHQDFNSQPKKRKHAASQEIPVSCNARNFRQPDNGKGTHVKALGFAPTELAFCNFLFSFIFAPDSVLRRQHGTYTSFVRRWNVWHAAYLKQRPKFSHNPPAQPTTFLSFFLSFFFLSFFLSLW